MKMSRLFTALAIFIWVGLGAAIVLFAWMFVERRRMRDEPSYAPHAELLGKPCWMVEGGDYSKVRVVAVSHKGSVAIRRWEDDSGRHAKWITHKQVAKGWLRFGENPEEVIG